MDVERGTPRKKEDDVSKKNRPDMNLDFPKGVMFATGRSTGWGHIRNLDDYKGSKKEGDFSHLHKKFADSEDAA